MKTLSTLLESINNPSTPNAFVILKPGFTDYKDEFLNLLANNGWQVMDTTLRKLTRDEVEQLYGKLKDEPFYQHLCDYMITDNCLCCTCHKDCENPIEEMNSLKKKVREEWGEDDMKNAMHSSDSLDNVKRESKLCIQDND